MNSEDFSPPQSQYSNPSEAGRHLATWTMKQPDPKSAARKLLDHLFDDPNSRQPIDDADLVFQDYLAEPRTQHFFIEADAGFLTEATRARVGRFTARRDQPHHVGDEYHGHCDVGGGHEVGWGISGKRRHPSKFPATVPRDSKQAVASVLGVSVDLLECYWSEEHGQKILLFELKTRG